ncbi:hypothetical protein RhiirC2_129826 [Rhizophagus irregularis]|jgi:hypothetical protein|uniref:Uncharacterized protein n=1 Tax=Rhizophagus irregularis TaxID=588596 RepID=A0A2N1P2M0_9GLOM|nr:hypothetical protein RhiirC2_129826 [Rhizophagus irregularis]
MNNNSVSLPNKSIREHRYRKGYLKKQAKNLDRKEHESNKTVSFSQINHVGLTYENYNRSINKEINYINKNNEKRKVWFSGRTKMNTKFNKFLVCIKSKSTLIYYYFLLKVLFYRLKTTKEMVKIIMEIARKKYIFRSGIFTA